MTSTERSRQYRERKKQQGKREANLIFTKETMNKLDEVVEFFELPSRSVAISELVDAPLQNAISALQGFKDSPEYDELMMLKGQQAEFWRNIRKAAWIAICSQDKKTRDEVVQSLEKMLDAE